MVKTTITLTGLDSTKIAAVLRSLKSSSERSGCIVEFDEVWENMILRWKYIPKGK